MNTVVFKNVSRTRLWYLYRNQKTEKLNHFTNLQTTILPQFHNFWHNVEPQFPTKGTGGL